MKAIQCNICDATIQKQIATKMNYTLLKCTNCNLVFMDPTDTPGDLADFYDNRRGPIHIPEDIDRILKDWKQGQKENFNIFHSRFPVPGKILDVGCSLGYFLYLAKENCWATLGVEISQQRAASANEMYGVTVKTGRFEDLELPAELDVISFCDTLEHIGNPRIALKKSFELLKPGGGVFLALPNIGGLEPQATYHLIYKTIGYWKHPEPPAHLFEYSPATITKLLELTGFINVEVINLVSDFREFVSENRLSPHDVKAVFAFNSRMIAIKSLVKRISYAFTVFPIYLASRVLHKNSRMIVIAKKPELV